MTTAEDGENWTGPRLTARLIALKAAAPDPVAHVIFRSTHHGDGSLTEGYLVAGELQPLAAEALDTWLNIRHPTVDRLAVAVLVIRETLDATGMLLQCTIERRRGAADGPYCGNPARVDFAGAATAIRLYRSHPDGRLTEVTPNTDVAAPRLRAPTQFAGERRALQARFGPTVAILDSREPSLCEDMVGLSSIAHVRPPDGRTIGCGIGWFGDISFVLEAGFPRFSTPLELPDTDEAAVSAALRDNNLVRGETRRDQNGIAVTGRRRGSNAMYLVRPTGDGVRVEPHAPGREVAGPDQQRWIHYVEAYEGLTVLDVWRDGGSNAVIILTSDLSGQIWRHHIDIDGVETWRQAGEEAAIGAVHRERLFPGTLADANAAPAAADAAPPPSPAATAPNIAGSLLSRAEAYARALAAARGARDAEPAALRRQLDDLSAAAEMLDAHVTASAARALRSRRDVSLVAALEPMLRQELATLHCIVLPAANARPFQLNEPPFGARVAAAFPSASHDIAEAAMCLALRRPTACMFHCVRVIESAIAAFARCIKVDGRLAQGERSWDAILRTLHCDGDTVPAFSQLEAVRRCWRGPTLTPEQKYTEQEAEDIFASVATLMRTISELCDERGTRSSLQT
jgi:hypothetical protein